MVVQISLSSGFLSGQEARVPSVITARKIKEGVEHDCWTTTEAALKRSLSEDLQEDFDTAITVFSR